MDNDHNVEVVNPGSGRPTIRLSGGALEVANALGITRNMISISHCRSHATAYAMALAGEP